MKPFPKHKTPLSWETRNQELANALTPYICTDNGRPFLCEHTDCRKIRELLERRPPKNAPILLPRRPLRGLTNASVRNIIERFIETGESGRHSPNAGTVQYVLDYCEENLIPYRITYSPMGGGYFVQRLNDRCEPAKLVGGEWV
jgi:hypothetical protein